MAANPNNHGGLIGRLASDPRIFTNNEGYTSVLGTLMVDRDYVSTKTGKRETDALDFEALVGPSVEGAGPYERVHAGDLVALQTTMRKDVYVKNGETVYAQKVIAQAVTFLESRSVTQERLTRRAEKAQAQNEVLKAQSAGPDWAQPQQAPAQAAPVAQPVQAAPVQAQAPASSAPTPQAENPWAAGQVAQQATVQAALPEEMVQPTPFG